MPALPAPMPFDPWGAELPVKSESDVRDVLPGNIKAVPQDDAPVREAIISAETEMFLSWQESSSYAAAQSDPTRAEGEYLDGHLEDRDLKRNGSEDDESARSRMFDIQKVVTPEAILAAADSILSPYTTIKCQYLESVLDRWFLTGPVSSFRSFIGASPEYPDRYYNLRPQSSPGGAWTFADNGGRYFVLRVPVLDSLNGSHMFLFDGTVEPGPGNEHAEAAWIADGSDTGGTESTGVTATFVSVGGGAALDIYQSVADAVNSIIPAGVRWQLYADPDLR